MTKDEINNIVADDIVKILYKGNKNFRYIRIITKNPAFFLSYIMIKNHFPGIIL